VLTLPAGHVTHEGAAPSSTGVMLIVCLLHNEQVEVVGDIGNNNLKGVYIQIYAPSHCGYQQQCFEI
jgi:hypothetical protein